ncbi:MAG TPA: NADH-quinone oxidoreductase subunit C [Cytophagaceae bacterium]
MSFEEIRDLLTDKLGAAVVVREDNTAVQPQLVVARENLIKVCQELYSNEKTYFDYLSCITGLDNGPEKGTVEVIYNLYSIPYNHHFVLKVEIQRGEVKNTEPFELKIPTVTGIWRTADWHEREIYDMFGVVFEGHRDLRRILLPADWEGFPLRKDYQQQEYYHGIKVKY